MKYNCHCIFFQPPSPYNFQLILSIVLSAIALRVELPVYILLVFLHTLFFVSLHSFAHFCNALVFCLLFFFCHFFLPSLQINDTIETFTYVSLLISLRSNCLQDLPFLENVQYFKVYQGAISSKSFLYAYVDFFFLVFFDSFVWAWKRCYLAKRAIKIRLTSFNFYKSRIRFVQDICIWLIV